MNKGYSVTVEAVTHTHTHTHTDHCLNKKILNTCGKASVTFVAKKYIGNMRTSFM